MNHPGLRYPADRHDSHRNRDGSSTSFFIIVINSHPLDILAKFTCCTLLRAGQGDIGFDADPYLNPARRKV